MSGNDDLRDQYELYALGLLDEPERSQIEEAIRTDAEGSRERLRRAMENNSLLLASVPLVEPPGRLRNRVLVSVGAKSHSSRSWLGIWAAVTAGLFVATLYFGARYSVRTSELAEVRSQMKAVLSQSAKTNAELARVRHVMSFLDSADTRVVTFGPKDPKPPRGRVLLHPNRGVVLLASNLPQAPAGKIYEMWIIPNGGKGTPVPAGLFQTDDNGSALHVQETTVPLDAVIAVTLEPESGSPGPTTTPLFAAGL